MAAREAGDGNKGGQFGTLVANGKGFRNAWWMPPWAGRPLVWVVSAIALLVLAGLALILSPYWATQVATVAYVLCATSGLTLLLGMNDQISLGQGAFMAVGGYTTAILMTTTSTPLLVVALLSVLVTIVFGVVVGAAASRLHGPYLAGATMLFAIGLPAVASYSPLEGTLGGASGIGLPLFEVPEFLQPYLTPEHWVSLIALAATVVLVTLLVNYAAGPFGRRLRAVRDDEAAAAGSGIEVGRVRLEVFVLSAAAAGLGGFLMAIVGGVVAPGSFTLTLSLTLLIAIIIGGSQRFLGAMIGSALLVFLPVWLQDFAIASGLSENIYGNLPNALYGLLVIVILLVFPSGLAGVIASLFRWIGGQREENHD